MAMDLVWRVFSEFEAPEYTLEGIHTFQDYISYKAIRQNWESCKIKIWGAFQKGRLAGIIALSGADHISLFFVEKNHQGRGIGKRLFDVALQECRQDKTVCKITVNSSPYAVRIYQKLGFSAVGTEQMADGIRFTPMEYGVEKAEGET